MKKSLILAVFCGFLAACGTPNVMLQMENAELVKAYQQTLNTKKVCSVDEDCVSVPKGCCLCDGQEAVNKKYEAKLAKQREKACGVGPCTLQMCYTDIDVSCVDNVCTGTPKPYKDYFVK